VCVYGCGGEEEEDVGLYLLRLCQCKMLHLVCCGYFRCMCVFVCVRERDCVCVCGSDEEEEVSVEVCVCEC